MPSYKRTSFDSLLGRGSERYFNIGRIVVHWLGHAHDRQGGALALVQTGWNKVKTFHSMQWQKINDNDQVMLANSILSWGRGSMHLLTDHPIHERKKFSRIRTLWPKGAAHVCDHTVRCVTFRIACTSTHRYSRAWSLTCWRSWITAIMGW